MPFTDIYRKQVELLVQTLPQVAEETCFSLKGGTAINLFVRDMPRLSVDIDLTYLPIADRDYSLAKIDAALKRIGDRIKRLHPRSVRHSRTPCQRRTEPRTHERARDLPNQSRSCTGQAARSQREGYQPRISDRILRHDGTRSTIGHAGIGTTQSYRGGAGWPDS